MKWQGTSVGVTPLTNHLIAASLEPEGAQLAATALRIRAGAAGYLLKDSAHEDIVAAIEGTASPGQVSDGWTGGSRRRLLLPQDEGSASHVKGPSTVSRYA